MIVFLFTILNGRCLMPLYLYFVFLTSEMYHLLALLFMLSSAAGDGNFRFTDTHVVVPETSFTEASFGIARTGGQSQSVFLTCKVSYGIINQ